MILSIYGVIPGAKGLCEYVSGLSTCCMFENTTLRIQQLYFHAKEIFMSLKLLFYIANSEKVVFQKP